MLTFDRERLRLGATGLEVQLDERQLDQFETYARRIEETNRVMNLTRVPWEEYVPRHFLDSLTTAKVASFHPDMTVLDVGTGVGLPGIALKIAFPQIKLTLLDTKHKYIQYLDRACKELGFNDVMLLEGRAEEIAHNKEHRDKYHLVVARALSAMPVLTELTLPFVRISGLLVALKSEDARKEIEEAKPVIISLGGNLIDILEVSLPTTDIVRLLPVIRKFERTPSNYPRAWKLIKGES